MITARQKMLLEAIINEFVETAQAVGSIDLPQKYDMRVSPATIRNEMATLVDMGYLAKPHASSGRIPTTLAFKYFLHDILEQLDELDVRDSAILSEDLFQKRYNQDQLILSAVRALAQLTGNASVALIDDRIYHYGLNNLVDNPEYRDLNTLKRILALLEDYAEISSIFRRNRSDQKVQVLIGDDFENDALKNSALVFTDIPIYGGSAGVISVFGPNRMRFNKVIPALRYISSEIANALHDWRR